MGLVQSLRMCRGRQSNKIKKKKNYKNLPFSPQLRMRACILGDRMLFVCNTMRPNVSPARRLSPPPRATCWTNSTVVPVVAKGAAAAEAALALSTDEILPSGLVDYFLVVSIVLPYLSI